MGDGTKELVRAIADSVPLKDAYEDLVQPAARETGRALAQVGTLLNSALRPLKTLQLSWDALFGRLDDWLAEKLSGVPPEEMTEPSPNVVGGVVTGLLFAQEEQVLRDMFVQLLATGMTKTGSRLAHPAFAEFIKQMTPLEARLVRAMARHGDIATLTIRNHEKAATESKRPFPGRGLSREGFMKLIEDPLFESWSSELRLTTIDVPDGAPPTGEVSIGFGNLERLGLVHSSTELTLTENAHYLKIATCDRAMTAYEEVKNSSCIPGLLPGLISITDLGSTFLLACLPRKRTEAG